MHSPNQSSIQLPHMNLTMQGGSQFFVNSPIEMINLVDYVSARIFRCLVLCLCLILMLPFWIDQGIYVYCLAIVKSDDVNIIGREYVETKPHFQICYFVVFIEFIIFAENFMTGYQIVFNNEKLALGWKASNCK